MLEIVWSTSYSPSNTRFPFSFRQPEDSTSSSSESTKSITLVSPGFSSGFCESSRTISTGSDTTPFEVDSLFKLDEVAFTLASFVFGSSETVRRALEKK